METTFIIPAYIDSQVDAFRLTEAGRNLTEDGTDKNFSADSLYLTALSALGGGDDFLSCDDIVDHEYEDEQGDITTLWQGMSDIEYRALMAKFCAMGYVERQDHADKLAKLTQAQKYHLVQKEKQFNSPVYRSIEHVDAGYDYTFLDLLEYSTEQVQALLNRAHSLNDSYMIRILTGLLREHNPTFMDKIYRIFKRIKHGFKRRLRSKRYSYDSQGRMPAL